MSHITDTYICPVRGGVYFLVKGSWGCAAGWSYIFITGLTIMEFTFLVEGVAHFQDLWDKKVLVSRNLKRFMARSDQDRVYNWPQNRQ